MVCGAATVMVHATDGRRGARTAAEPWLTVRRRRGAGARRPEHRGRSAPRASPFPAASTGPISKRWPRWPACGPDEVAALLTAQPLTAAVVGFSPGFAYLEGLPAALQRVPRRARPRPVVPAGSVAIANGHAAVYPTASPGGWHLVGRTGFPSVHRGAPALRRAGAGGPGPVHAWPQRRSRRAGAGGRAAVVPAGRGAGGVRDRGAGPAGRGAGRRPPGRGGRGRAGGRSRRPGVLRAGQPVDGQRGRIRARSSSPGAGPGCAVSAPAMSPSSAPPPRCGSTARRNAGRTAAALATPDRCWRSVASARGCRSYLAVAGGLLGPEWFGSARPTS